MQRNRKYWPALLLALGLPALAGAADAPAAPSQEETQKKLAEAQQRLDAAAREVAQLSAELGRGFARRIIVEAGPGRGPGPGGAPRARGLLGVNIDGAAHRDGAHVLNVSPGGAAAEAGIRAGDVIVSIAGTDLTKDSNPGRALVERVAQLEPEQKVQVAVLRDGKRQNLDVTLRPAPEGAMAARPLAGGPPDGGPGVMLRRRLESGGRPGPGEGVEGIRLNILEALGQDGRFRDLEFATLSERLGGYFGVKAGVLVVRAGVNSPYQLQDGDVILAVDGREVSTAQHVGRILRSYLPGEKLKLRVQRDRRAIDIEVTMPRDGRG